MRVKIVKNPDSGSSWYYGLVGQVLEVEDAQQIVGMGTYYRLSTNRSFGISVKDAEIVPDQPEPTRKIVQITSTLIGISEYLYAVCNDGSVWFMMDPSKEEKWERLPEIPQEG